MKLNDILNDLLSLADQENEHNRYAHSEEYNKLYDELDRKTIIIDELENQLGCPLDVLIKALKDAGSTKIEYHEIRGCGHNCWTACFDDFHNWERLFSFKKN